VSALSELPEGWVGCRVGNIAELIRGVTYKKADARNEAGEGYTPLLRANNINRVINHDELIFVANERVSDAQLLQDGDVLIAMSSGSKSLVGKAAQVMRGQCETFGAFCAAARVFEDIDKRYFGWFFQTQRYRDGVSADAKGSNINNLKRAHILEVSFPVAPLNEQRRIVEKIETLFAQLDKGEEALRNVQKLLARYRQSVLKAAVTGELTADWRAENTHRLEHGRDLLARILETRRETWEGRGKYKEPVEPDTADLPELPEGWVWATLPMLGEFGRGKSKHRPRNDPKLYKGGKYPFLQTGRVRNSAGRISEYDALYSEFGLAQSKIWPKGTVCITIAANIAESGILELDACFPDSVVGLVPHPEVNAEYIECFIRTAKENLDRYAPATAQKNINLEILNAVAVPLPPGAEQVEIRDRIDTAFSTIDSTEMMAQTELARSAALRQSILKGAFAGRLVPQDPTDEPAADLLARIKEARAAAPPKTRKKARV
jgi:type I restriction enzyme S subunit